MTVKHVLVECKNYHLKLSINYNVTNIKNLFKDGGIGLANDVLQKLSKVLRKKSLETKKCVLDCNVIFILLYGREYWTIPTADEEKIENNSNVFLQNNQNFMEVESWYLSVSLYRDCNIGL